MWLGEKGKGGCEKSKSWFVEKGKARKCHAKKEKSVRKRVRKSRKGTCVEEVIEVVSLTLNDRAEESKHQAEPLASKRNRVA